jgi:hypothetical protein
MVEATNPQIANDDAFSKDLARLIDLVSACLENHIVKLMDASNLGAEFSVRFKHFAAVLQDLEGSLHRDLEAR